MEKQTSRLESFSDGIFGVAITLLALDIGISEYPNANNFNLWQAIVEKWPAYFTYFNSFATVLLIWMGHNSVVRRLRLTNHGVLLFNGLLLLLVVLFPYPTKLVGTFIGTAAQNTAVSFYCAFTGGINLSMFALTAYISRSKQLLVSPRDDLPWLRSMLLREAVGLCLYGVCAALAFYSAPMALGVTFVMWIYWAVTVADDAASDVAQ
jgi:uncharacterized membrane protein